MDDLKQLVAAELATPVDPRVAAMAAAIAAKHGPASRAVLFYGSCLRERRPLVIVSTSGGARMQEGILSLMQLPKTVCAVEDLHDAHIPMITVMALAGQGQGQTGHRQRAAAAPRRARWLRSSSRTVCRCRASSFSCAVRAAIGLS